MQVWRRRGRSSVAPGPWEKWRPDGHRRPHPQRQSAWGVEGAGRFGTVQVPELASESCEHEAGACGLWWSSQLGFIVEMQDSLLVTAQAAVSANMDLDPHSTCSLWELSLFLTSLFSKLLICEVMTIMESLWRLTYELTQVCRTRAGRKKCSVMSNDSQHYIMLVHTILAKISSQVCLLVLLVGVKGTDMKNLHWETEMSENSKRKKRKPGTTPPFGEEIE